MDLVNKRFGPPVRSNPFGELTHLCRTGTVRECEVQFLQLLARCEHITECQQIDIFTAGLRNPLRIDVELQRPDSLEDAMGLARAFERRLEIDDDTLPPASRPSSRTAPLSRGSHPPSVSLHANTAAGDVDTASCDSSSLHQGRPGARETLQASVPGGDGAPSCRGALLQLPREIHARPPQALHHEGDLLGGVGR